MSVLFLKQRNHWCEDGCDGQTTGLSLFFYQTAAYLRRCGINLTSHEFDEFDDGILEKHTVVVYFIAQFLIDDFAAVIAQAKDRGLVTIVCLHDSYQAEEEVMRRYDFIDVCIVYPDREKVIYDVLTALRNGDGRGVPSTVYRDGDNLIRTPPRTMGNDLTHLNSCVPELHGVLPNLKYTHVYLRTGRGCHFGCAFCDTRRTIERKRSPEVIADEMVFVQQFEHLKQRLVSLIDPLFISNSDWVRELCEAFIRKEVNMGWRTTTHYQTVKPDLLPLLREAGCKKISMGLEGLNDPGLKPVHLDKFRQTVETMRENNVWPIVNVIVGVWEDDDDRLSALEAYVRDLGPVDLFVTPFYPLPNTPLYSKYQGLDLIDRPSYRDFAAWGYTTPLLPTHALTVEELKAWTKRFQAISAYEPGRINTDSPQNSGYGPSRTETASSKNAVMRTWQGIKSGAREIFRSGDSAGPFRG